MPSPALRVAIALAGLQLALHAIAWAESPDPRMLLPHAVALLHDLFILGATALLASAAGRLLPGGDRSAGHVVPVLALCIVGILLSIYPQTLREFLAFPVNLLAADSDAAGVMLWHYLGLWRLWPALAAIAVTVAALRLSLIAIPKTRLTVATALLILVAALLTLPRSPNPLVFSVAQSLSALASPKQREVASLSRPPARSTVTIEQQVPFSTPSGPDLPKHVFLIVLEGVTAADFESEFLRKADGFYEKYRERALYFDRYYATNLDSYTSLIAMLTAIQVPYRAYADESLYGAVNDTANVTRILRQAGYHTAFLSTYQYQPFVPTRRDWDRVIDRTALPSLDGWASLGSSRMEAATEDKAALFTIVDLAARHHKTFVLHELVYGHSKEWRAITGKTQLSYYDEYLEDLSNELANRGLLDHSLLVIVSDHGDRSRSSYAENYRVPLLIVGSDVPPSRDSEFRSHLDLPAILSAVMGRHDLPGGRVSQHVVGSSERWIYGQIWCDGSSLFIEDATGSVAQRQGPVHAAAVQRSFQSLLDAFGANFGVK